MKTKGIKVYHLVEDFSFHSGGLRTAILGLTNNVKGVEHIIVSTNKDVNDNIIVFEGKGKWRYSYSLKTYLMQIENDQKTVFHLHGIWLYTTFIGAKIAKKKNIPYIITFHGMLEPFHNKKNSFQKKLYKKVILDNLVRNAKLIHTITPIESKNLSKSFSFSFNYFEIPNSILFRTSENIEVFNNNILWNDKYILFLGRIAEQKGIDLLIRSIARIGNEDLKLKIVGPIDRNNKPYYLFLKQLIEKLNISTQIEFLGMKTGIEKEKIIRNAFYMVAPSRSEAIGIVNLEAALQNTPVISSLESGLDKKWSENGGYLIDPFNNKELDNVILKFWYLSIEERNERGLNLKNFVYNNYSWERNSIKWVNIYKRCLS